MLPALKRGLPPDRADGCRAGRADRRGLDGDPREGGRGLPRPRRARDWRAPGRRCDGERVYPDRGLVRELIATIPESFTYHARNPANNLPFGRDHAIFVPMTGAPYCAISTTCAATRRWPISRTSTSSRTCCPRCTARRITSSNPMTPDQPAAPAPSPHSSMKHSDKTFMGMTTSPRNAEDVLEMCAILFGAEFMEDAPGRHRQLQRQLASRLGRDDAGRDARLLPAQPAGAVLALRAGRGQHAGLAPTVAQLNAEALSRAGLHPGHPQGRPAIYGHYLRRCR